MKTRTKNDNTVYRWSARTKKFHIKRIGRLFSISPKELWATSAFFFICQLEYWVASSICTAILYHFIKLDFDICEDISVSMKGFFGNFFIARIKLHVPGSTRLMWKFSYAFLFPNSKLRHTVNTCFVLLHILLENMTNCLTCSANYARYSTCKHSIWFFEYECEKNLCEQSFRFYLLLQFIKRF